MLHKCNRRTHQNTGHKKINPILFQHFIYLGINFFHNFFTKCKRYIVSFTLKNL